MAIHKKVLIDEVGELGPLEGSLKRHLIDLFDPLKGALINMLKPS